MCGGQQVHYSRNLSVPVPVKGDSTDDKQEVEEFVGRLTSLTQAMCISRTSLVCGSPSVCLRLSVRLSVCLSVCLLSLSVSVPVFCSVSPSTATASWSATAYLAELYFVAILHICRVVHYCHVPSRLVWGGRPAFHKTGETHMKPALRFCFELFLI